MGGLLWTSVIDGRINLPTDATRALAKLDMATVAHHERLWATISTATRKLNDQGIVSVVFKGVTDEARWFNRPGERPCSDVDLVICDIDRFDDAIRALEPDHPLIGSAADAAYRGLLRAVNLTVDGILVDLHVDPVKVGSGWRNPERWFAQTALFETPLGDTITVFDEEATAALRLLHIGRDKFRYLLWLIDVGRIIDSAIDWEATLGLAASEGLAAPVGVAAEVVAEELTLPRRKWAPPGWRTSLWRRLWSPRVRLLGELGRKRFVRRSSWLLPLSMPGRLTDTVIWLARTAVPPAELFDLKHPGGRGPYPWRLVSRRTEYLVRRRVEARREQRSPE